ncbi:MAG TPA: hypothetical protein VGS80_25605 [Ktedonobacterales bacterium]|nr:hypothetical protein [Ktedonobacterales bacterium]
MLKAQVNTLRRISTVLRPDGVLLNLLPDTTHRAVAVRVGGGAIQRLGHLDDTRDIKEFQAVLAAQQAALDAGLFVLERETSFTIVDHFDTVERWLTNDEFKRAIIPAKLVARAGALLPPGTAGDVHISREFYAARLRRAGAGGGRAPRALLRQ